MTTPGSVVILLDASKRIVGVQHAETGARLRWTHKTIAAQPLALAGATGVSEESAANTPRLAAALPPVKAAPLVGAVKLCNWCGKAPLANVADGVCPHCGDAAYCNDVCHVAHADDYHVAVCSRQLTQRRAHQ